VNGVSRVKRLNLLTVLVGISIVLGISPCSAHTSLLSSTPAINSKLAKPPTMISLQFDEDLIVLGSNETNQVSVTNTNGVEFVLGKSRVLGSILEANLDNNNMNSGEFTVKYRVVSADGHVVSSSFHFTITDVTGNQELQTHDDAKLNAGDSQGGTIVSQNSEKPVSSSDSQKPETTVSQSHASHLLHKHKDHIIYTAIGFALIGGWYLYRKYSD